MHCPHCNQEHPDGFQYCTVTGNKIEIAAICTDCGRQVEPGWVHCAYCGGRIKEEGQGDRKALRATAPVRYEIPASQQEIKPQTRKTRIPLLLIGIGLVLITAVIGFSVLQNRMNLPAVLRQNPPGKILFVSNRDGNNEIYLMNADGSGTVNLSNNPADDSSPALSPDGQKIAFTSNRDAEQSVEIYLMNADGSNQTRLTTGGQGFGYYAFSPDSKKLAFSAIEPFSVDLANKTALQDIYIIDIASGDQTLVLENWTYLMNFGFAWTPDGQKLAYTSIRNGVVGIYTINPDGSGETALSTNYDASFHFSADGRRMVFVSGRDGKSTVYVMNADGSGQTPLTQGQGEDTFPSWSPDGRKVAFLSNRDGNWEIYVMNPDGSSQVRLTTSPGDETFLTWSPDSSRIAFITSQDGKIEINLMDADGKNQLRLTNQPGDHFSPVWFHVEQTTPDNEPTVVPAAAQPKATVVKPTNPLGIGGYWKSIGSQSFTVSLSDNEGNQAVLEVQGELRWDKDGKLDALQGNTFRIQTPANPGQWYQITGAEVIDGLLILTAEEGVYTHFTEGSLPAPLAKQPIPAVITGDGKWKGQAEFIITGFNPQDFSAVIYLDPTHFDSG